MSKTKKTKTSNSPKNLRNADATHASEGGDIAVAVAPEEGAAAAAESQAATEESAHASVPATSIADGVPAKRSKSGSKKKAKHTNAATVGDVAKGYLEQLEQRAASASTLFSYELELMSAMEELGADKPIASLTKKEVETFFESPRVMRTKRGSEKSPLSIAKTRRVFRQALVWAVGAGLIEQAPLPEEARKE